MKNITVAIQEKGMLILVYMANLFLSFHYYTTAYVNSSFLSNFASKEKISVIFIIASAISLVCLIYASPILRTIGNYRLTLYCALLDILAVFGLSRTNDGDVAILLLIVHLVTSFLILFCLDIFLEHYTKSEKATGEVRGAFLTIANAALVIAPLFVSILGVTQSDFSPIYLLSAAFLVPLILITVFSLKDFKDPEYRGVNLRDDLSKFLGNKNIANVFGANLILQIFYAFMVIYVPIYLYENIGFSWVEIGLILAVALLPFLLFEYPIGVVADKILGEKEMMVFGFMIITVFLIFIPLIKVASLTIFAFLMFMTRVGAALVETTTESYFFKQTKDASSDFISIFRMTRPLAYILGPILGFVALSFTTLPGLFVALSGVILFGIPFATRIKDSR